MKKRKMNVNISVMLVLLLLVSTLAYIFIAEARYIGSASGEITAKTAKWAVKVNDVDIVENATSFGTVPLVVSSSTNVATDKIAPSLDAVGVVEINPAGTEVSFAYDIELGEIVDAPEDLEIVVKEDGNVITEIGGKYSGSKLLTIDGAFTIEDKIDITIEAYWYNDEINNSSDTVLGLAGGTISIPVTITFLQIIEPPTFKWVEINIEKAIFNKQLSTNVIIKNNNGTDFMEEDLEYTLSIDNNKFDSVITDASGGILQGGSANSNTIPIVITPKQLEVFSDTETIRVKCNVTAPFVDERTVTVKYIDYVKNALELHYDGINNTGAGYSATPAVWKDLVGNNNGTFIGTTTWDGKGLGFNGTNTKVSFKGDITNEYTMSVVILPVLTGQYPRLIGEASGNTVFPGIYLHSVNGYKLGLYGHKIDSIYSNNSATPSTTERTSIVVTYSGGVSKLYVNGEYIGELNVPSSVTSQTTAYLGANGASNRYYTGKMYSFLRYSKVLTADEIKHNYDVDELRFGEEE